MRELCAGSVRLVVLFSGAITALQHLNCIFSSEVSDRLMVAYLYVVCNFLAILFINLLYLLPTDLKQLVWGMVLFRDAGVSFQCDVPLLIFVFF